MLIAKMHGAGNDFVVVEGAPPADGRAAQLVRALADRHRGIGSDGVLFLERLSDGSADLRMHFYNCDGGRAGLCLNGARCAALRAMQLGWTGSQMRIRTEHGFLSATVDEGHEATRVQLVMPLPAVAPRKVELLDQAVAGPGWAVHTGDPHLVVEVESPAKDDFESLARPLRWWTGPDAAGSNVHFVHRAADHWTIRSFERGIEAETQACGSGCVAALLALEGTEGSRRARLITRRGDAIEVGLRDGELELEGPAVCVFTTNWTGDGSS